MNQELLNKKQVSPELEGVIESYELAFRMQNTVPTLMDVSSESKETLDMYGVGVKETDNFGRQCCWHGGLLNLASGLSSCVMGIGINMAI